MEFESRKKPVEDSQEMPTFQPGSELYPAIPPPPYPGLPPTPTPKPIPSAPPIDRVFIGVMPVGMDPSTIVCIACQQEMTTRIRQIPTWRTHLMAIIMCAIGCWPCACRAYLI